MYCANDYSHKECESSYKIELFNQLFINNGINGDDRLIELIEYYIEEKTTIHPLALGGFESMGYKKLLFLLDDEGYELNSKVESNIDFIIKHGCEFYIVFLTLFSVLIFN